MGLDSWLLPGLWLAGSVAVPCAIATTAAWRRSPWAGLFTTAAALLLLVELVVQVPFVGFDPLQAVMGEVALVLLVLAPRLPQAPTPPAHDARPTP